MTSALVWLGLLIAGLAYEFFTLKDSDDLHEPLTWHLRRLLQRPWFVILAIGFYVWLPGHLLGWWP